MEKTVSKVKSSKTLSVLVHGANQIGYAIAQTLLDQGGKVIIIDEYTAKTKKYITDLKKHGEADFIDFKGIEDLYESINRIDYTFYILNTFLEEKEEFTSKDFLEESNHLNNSLKASERFGAKVSLITTIQLNKSLAKQTIQTDVSKPSPYSPTELQKYCETLTAEYRDKSKLNTRILRLGTLLGKSVNTINDATINRLISEAAKKSFLTIIGEGLEQHFIINISDAVYGILKLTFTDKAEGEVISLTNDHDYTTLSIAYKLLELDTDAQEIKFEEDADATNILGSQYIPAVNAAEFGWKQKVPVEQTMIETLSTYDPNLSQRFESASKKLSSDIIKKKVSQSKSSKTTLGKVIDGITNPFKNLQRKIKDNKADFKNKLTPINIIKWSVGGILSILALYFLIIPLISISIGSYLSYKGIKDAYQDIVESKPIEASEKIEQVNQYTKKLSASIEHLSWIFEISNNSELYDNIIQLSYGAQYASNGAKDLLVASEPLITYINDFEPALDFENGTPSTTREYRSELLQLRENAGLIEKSSYDLIIASNMIDSVDPSVFPTSMQEKIVELKSLNSELSEYISPLQNTIKIMPDVLGVDERQRYIILLQNPGELRSTGGWISSYAILGIEGGQIRELVVDDIYNADGQLKVQDITITPPTSLKNALEISNWSFSLVNWDPDLPTVASATEEFIQKLGKGTDIDGVITVDTDVIKTLLEKWDGLEVPGESEIITADNLDEKIFEIHGEFVPGSPVKATFLANLANETLKKTLSSSPDEYKNISSSIFQSLDEKSIMIYFSDAITNKYFSNQRWSGEIDSTYAEVPFNIDWNWGANKANLFLEQSTSLKIDVVDTSKVNYSYALIVKNTSTSKQYPQGDYINYMRLYLPESSILESIDGFIDDEYQIYNEHGYKIVGGFFNTAASTTKKFEIAYTIESNTEDEYNPIISTNNGYTLDLTIFKQPGSVDSNYDLEITYPTAWAALKHDELNRSINTLETQFDHISDKDFNIVWELK